MKNVFNKAPTKFTSFSSTLTTLKSIAMAGSRAAAESGLQAAVTMGSGVSSGVAVGAGFASMTLFPLGAALAPWLGALAIAQASTGIFALYNLKEAATRSGPGGYPCSCGDWPEKIEKQQALILETTAIIWSDDSKDGGLVRLKTKW